MTLGLNPTEFAQKLKYISQISRTDITRINGTISQISGQAIHITGLSSIASLGDLIEVEVTDALTMNDKLPTIKGEIISLENDYLIAIMYSDLTNIRLNQPVYIVSQDHFYPSEDWVGRVLNYEAQDLLTQFYPQKGYVPVSLTQLPVPAINRKTLGPRLRTGIAAFDTFLPICQGQRVGLFAGSGVGKSTLLATLAKHASSDINVIALIGERGREVRHFVETTLGEEGMKKSILFVATSDMPSAVKLRTAKLAMSTAEYFRDQGKHVLFLFDSLTRYAEAHRDVALAAGEIPSLRAYPPSTFRALAQLCERAGPGFDPASRQRQLEQNTETTLPKDGDISAVFSVLVAGSDMEEPVADMVRGILDGHVILDRAIAERGRYPAINLRRSVSRSLPGAANKEENIMLSTARHFISLYEDAQTLIQAGLYKAGQDKDLDRAVYLYPQLDKFMSEINSESDYNAYESLEAILTQQPAQAEDPIQGAPKEGYMDLGL